MNNDKKVRVQITRQNIKYIIQTLSEYVKYAEERNFKDSIERAKPLLDYVLKKQMVNREKVPFQLTLKELGVIHDSLTDFILYYTEGIKPYIAVVEEVEVQMSSKANKVNTRLSDIVTTPVFQMMVHLKRDGKI